MQLPEDFVNNIRPLLGGEWNSFVEALESPIPVSIRLNPKKVIEKDSFSERVPWCENGYYLPERPYFTFDPLLHAGTYYVQEASSMFIEQVFKQYVGDKDVKVLDLCAAPGGKSTHIVSLISEKSLLVSNEVIKSRANILAENMNKWGSPNVVVTNNDPSDIGRLTHFFDVILVDAPCSGEGMFRKDAEVVEEWSVANVTLCKERQQRIIADVWNSLKPGGILIYSTCTYNRSENEDNIRWLLNNFDADSLPVEYGADWGVAQAYDEDINACHFFPHKVKGEGFFLSVLRKGEEKEATQVRFKHKKKDNKNTQSLAKEYQNYLKDNSEYTFFNKENIWFAFSSILHDDFGEIVSNLKLVSAGICIGEIKGKDFIPHHSLAMSNILNKNSFVCYEVNQETAIAYLRKEALLFSDLEKGYILLMYEGHPLGFVKNIGNRANNLYPNEWRIRTTRVQGK